MAGRSEGDEIQPQFEHIYYCRFLLKTDAISRNATYYGYKMASGMDQQELKILEIKQSSLKDVNKNRKVIKGKKEEK